MKKIYNSPEAEIIEFDTKDVITTSTELGVGEVVQETSGWTDLY